MALVASASAHGAARPDGAADLVALTACVVDADIRVAVITQWRSGTERAALLRAVQDTLERDYRERAERIVGEVYREQPQNLRPYVSERLQRCVAAAAATAHVATADDCYHLSRLARDVLAARDAGVSLKDTAAAVEALARDQGLTPDGVQRLADIVNRAYATHEPAPQFRAGLFYHCVMPARPGAR